MDVQSVLKGFLFKKSSDGNLHKFLPRTEAELVTMKNGNDVEIEITKIIDAISKIQPYESVIKSGSILDVKQTGIYYIGMNVTDLPVAGSHGMLIVAEYEKLHFVYVYICKVGGIFVRQIYIGNDAPTDTKWLEHMTLNDIAKSEIDSDRKVYSTNYFNQNVGKLSGLTTSVKSSIVAAINQIWTTLEERTNGKVKIYGDAEGGNIGILSKNNIYWEMDAVDDNLRLYTFWSDNNFTNYIFRGAGVDGGGTVALTKEVEKKMDKMTVVNNATTTVAGTLLDGRMGKTLHDDIANTQNYIPAVAKNNIISNALLINTNGKFNASHMYSGVIATEDASKISGCPVTSGAFYAYREVFFLPNQGVVGNTQGKTIVRLTESYPISGRVWITSYNTDIQNWSPWQEHAPFYANEAGIGSAYGVNALYKSSGRITTVYFSGKHVGDSMAAYSQRNMGTLPSGKRPSTKVQCQVPGINGLYLTVEPSGVVSMRNEHYETISFSPIIVSGAVTFVS